MSRPVAGLAGDKTGPTAHPALRKRKMSHPTGKQMGRLRSKGPGVSGHEGFLE